MDKPIFNKYSGRTPKSKEELIYDIKKVCEIKNFTFIEYIDDKVNTKSKFKVMCNVDNYTWTPNYNNFISKNSGCPICGDTLLRSEESALLIIKQICNKKKYKFIDFIDKKYHGAATKFTLTCDKCNCIWSPKYINFVHNKSGCPNCKKSKGELEIKKFLENNSIIFKQQKTFKDCKDKNVLPFDFYLPELNYCIEYDGSQHFISKEIWGGKNNFEIIKHHDNIKTNYCLNNNIRLIRINYKQNIIDELNKFVKIIRFIGV